MTQEPIKPRQGINSIDVGLKVLMELVSLGRPAALREIAEAADMHPAKLHRYLVSFVRGGFVQQNVGDGRYDLGPQALTFSLGCLARLDAIRVGSQSLESLMEETQESVFIAVWGDAGPTVVDWQPARRAIAASTHTGTVFPLVMSSTGRVFAAYMSAPVMEPYLAQELKDLRGSSNPLAPADRAELDGLLAEVRRRGLARGLSIRIPGINSFSVPVFDYRGKLAFALTAFGYEQTFDSGWQSPIATSLRAASARLSRQLGHSESIQAQVEDPNRADD
jgi:DNA-binding IclR family transcriptional regulator